MGGRYDDPPPALVLLSVVGLRRFYFVRQAQERGERTDLSPSLIRLSRRCLFVLSLVVHLRHSVLDGVVSRNRRRCHGGSGKRQ